MTPEGPRPRERCPRCRGNQRGARPYYSVQELRGRLIVTEQEVNAALDLLDRLADEVQADHPDLEDEQEACDLLGARCAITQPNWRATTVVARCARYATPAPRSEDPRMVG